MKNATDSYLAKITAVLLMIILVGLAFHSPMTVFLSVNLPNLAIYFKAWKEIVLIVAFIFVVILATKNKHWSRWKNDKLFWLLAIFAGWHLILAAFSLASGADFTSVAAGLLIDLRYPLIFATIFGFLQMYPQYRQRILLALLISAVIIVGFACLQPFLGRDFLTIFGYGRDTIAPYLTVDNNENYIRYSSTLRGPNPLGAVALTTITIAVVFIIDKWRKIGSKMRFGAILAVVCSSVALYISYSRSAILGAFVAILGVLCYKFGAKISKKSWIFGITAVVALLAGMLYLLRDTSFMHNVILHDDPNLGPSETSNAGHWSSLESGVSLLIAQPFGAGVGSTGSASLLGDSATIIENHFLFVAHEVGWFGMLIFVAILMMILQRLWSFRENWLACAMFFSGIGMIVVAMLLPVFADDVVALMWWALAATLLTERKRFD